MWLTGRMHKQYFAFKQDGSLEYLEYKSLIKLAECGYISANLIGFPSEAHKEIIRFYVTMKKSLLMHVLNSINLECLAKGNAVNTRNLYKTENWDITMNRRCSHHLISEHEHGLERELSTAVVEEVLEAGSEKINHHHIILSLHTKPLEVRNASF